MKIQTKKQFLAAIIVINLAVFSLIGAVLWYFSGMSVVFPLVAAAVTVIVMQYRSGSKKFAQ